MGEVVTRESYEMDVAMLPIAKLPVFTCRIGTMEQGCNNEVVLIIPGPGDWERFDVQILPVNPCLSLRVATCKGH